ncbi:hypothetical protein [Brucella oryzae]|uniref:hypothetical protein n=1 Tax=Brucella oryzae TaxID=335286 RepID=UPI00201331E9|nr:hypothetical protein [Brucella oryzae]
MTKPTLGLSAAKDGRDDSSSAPAPSALELINWRREIETRPSPVIIELLVMNSSPHFSKNLPCYSSVVLSIENCQDGKIEGDVHGFRPA